MVGMGRPVLPGTVADALDSIPPFKSVAVCWKRQTANNTIRQNLYYAPCKKQCVQKPKQKEYPLEGKGESMKMGEAKSQAPSH